MPSSPKPTNPQVQANLSELDIPQKLLLIALIAKFAPTSTQYAGNGEFKTCADRVIAHGPTLKSTNDAAETTKKTATAAANTRDAEEVSFDGDFNVFRALAETVLKTQADFDANGLSKRVHGAPVPLTTPVLVTAKPYAKVKGSILAHAKRIAGLTRYICAISVDPPTTASWVVQNGAQARRTILGLESGKGYWIKYCTERGSNRSDWSAPVYCVAS